MQAIILAGGQGTRLREYTKELPKSLVPISGRPVVEIILKQFQIQGVKEIIMAVNHGAEQIISTLGDGSQFNLNIRYSQEEKPLSTAAPLKLIENLNDHFIVANGDILTDLNVGDLYKAHVESGAMMTTATCKRRGQIEFGVIEADDSNRVVSFNEKPEFNYVVSMGIHIFSRAVLDYIPDNCSFGFDELILSLLEQKQHVGTYPFDGYWLDIGRPDDYEKAIADADLYKQWLSE